MDTSGFQTGTLLYFICSFTVHTALDIVTKESKHAEKITVVPTSDHAIIT